MMFKCPDVSMRVNVLISRGINHPWDPSGPWDQWGLDEGIICEKGGRGVIM